MVRGILVFLLLALGVGSVEVSECHNTAKSDTGDDVTLVQSMVHRVVEEKTVREVHTSRVLDRVKDMAEKVISGGEKISDATKLALDSIDDEMDNIIAHAEQSQKDFQAAVDGVKLAIEGCSTETTTSHTTTGGINDLAATVASAGTAHDTCRAEEARLKGVDTSKCTEFSTYWSGLEMPSCACSKASDLGAENMEQCIEKLKSWSTTSSDTFKTKKDSCTGATSDHTAKRTSCDTKQATYESDFCAYSTALTTTCSTQETCRSVQIDLRNTRHAAVNISEASFKAEFVSAKTVKCILGVLKAAESAQPSMLKACLSAAIDTSHLGITYHPIPPAATCSLTPIEKKPCDQYTEKTWLSDAPTQDCSACPASAGIATADEIAAATGPITMSGAEQSYTVPAGVTELEVKLWGAQGGNEMLHGGGHAGGGGAYVHGILPVTPGSTLTVIVGEGGRSGNTAESGVVGFGFGGLGRCRSTEGGCTSSPCNLLSWMNRKYGREIGDGGGLTGIFDGTPSRSTALVIAGGGGGASDSSPGKRGGQGSCDTPGLAGEEGRQPRTGGGGAGYCGGVATSQGNVKGGTSYVEKLTQIIANKVGSYGGSEQPAGHDDPDWDQSQTSPQSRVACHQPQGFNGHIVIKPIVPTCADYSCPAGTTKKSNPSDIQGASTGACCNTVVVPTASSGPLSFSLAGADQSYTVPSGVSQLEVKLWGAAGGSELLHGGGHAGGGGAFVHGFVSVTPGSTLTVVVGEGGRSGNTAETGVVGYGFGGLGRCRSTESGCTSSPCKVQSWQDRKYGREVGDGGGLTGLFTGTPSRDTALVIAGGGGGASDSSPGGDGGVNTNCEMPELAGSEAQQVRTGGGGAGYCGGVAKSQGNVKGGSSYVDKLTKVVTSDGGRRSSAAAGSDDPDYDGSQTPPIARAGSSACAQPQGGHGYIVIKPVVG